MVKGIDFVQSWLREHKMWWKALGALSLGALVGTLVAVPYDQVLGLSEPPYTVHLRTAVQSLIATATLFRVWVVDRDELVIQV